MRTNAVVNGRNVLTDKNAPCDFVGFTRNKITFSSAKYLSRVRFVDTNAFVIANDSYRTLKYGDNQNSSFKEKNLAHSWMQIRMT